MLPIPTFCSAQEYDNGRPGRLPSQKLEEACIYTFMMRLKGGLVEAFHMPADLHDIHQAAGRMAVRLCLKNADFEDMVQTNGYVSDGLWLPAMKDSIVIHNGVKASYGTEGYFMPYDDQLGLENLLATTSHSRELLLV